MRLAFDRERATEACRPVFVSPILNMAVQEHNLLSGVLPPPRLLECESWQGLCTLTHFKALNLQA